MAQSKQLININLSDSKLNAIKNLLDFFLVFGVVLILHKKILPLGLDLHHDLFMFDAARRMLDGEFPFQDFFYQYNLATVIFHVLALKVFGVKIISLKIATAYAYALIAGMIYACSSLFASRLVSAAVAIIWGLFSPFFMPDLIGYHAWSTVYMMASVMTGLYFFLRAVRGHSFFWALLAGVCFNLAFWFKQVAAIQIIFLGILLIYLMLPGVLSSQSSKRARQIFAGFALGGLGSAVPFFAYLLTNSLIEDWWNSAFVFNGLFASTSHSSSGLYAFFRTILPVTKEASYISILWALLPIYLIVYMRYVRSTDDRLIFSDEDAVKTGVPFVIILGFAGWFEYYPLAHSFHTQLYMAPVFVLLSTCLRCSKSTDSRSSYRKTVMFSFTFVVIVTLVFEAYEHIVGFRQKIKQEYSEIPGTSPASGLKLVTRDYNDFERFYRKFVKVKSFSKDSALIPRSVDPLRALLPQELKPSNVYKMGVDWTWPNEIVEPGFNLKVETQLKNRDSGLYADSVLSVPGYIPVGILEMSSPLTNKHVIYKPSSNEKVVEPIKYDIDGFGNLSAKSLISTGRVSMSNDIENLQYSYFELPGGFSIFDEEVIDVNIAIVRKSDLKNSLLKYEFEDFILHNNSPLAQKIKHLYSKGDDGNYYLAYPLHSEAFYNLLAYFISRGKLLKTLDLPVFFSTLSVEPHSHPIIFGLRNQPGSVSEDSDKNILKVFWSKLYRTRGEIQDDQIGYKMFITIPSEVVTEEEETLIFLQFVDVNNKTFEYFAFFRPK